MKNQFKLFNLFAAGLLLTIFSCSTGDEVNSNEITVQDFTATVDENPTNGQSIGTVQADGGGTLSFSITSQTPAGALMINTGSGELTVADATVFDFETNPVITANILLDNSSTTKTAVVTIGVNDIIEMAVPGNTDTEFVIGTTAYVTSKAYLLVDDAAGDFERSFSFVFSDGDIVEDATSEIAFETSTTHFTKVTCNLIATKPTLAETSFFVWDPQTNPNGFLSIIMDGNNYTRYGITSFSNTSSIGNQSFGQPDGGTTHNHTALANGDGSNGNLFTINARTFDLNTMTGTIDCSYSYVDDNNVTVTGVFVGSYEILTAF